MGAIEVVPSPPILCFLLLSWFGLLSGCCWDGRSQVVTHPVNIVLCCLGRAGIKRVC